MGFINLKYRRPAEQPIGRTLPEASQESVGGETLQEIPSPSLAGIPDALSFDRIIDGGTCPVSTVLDVARKRPNPHTDLDQPCTTRDFMNYLIYIEHSAENLQFFLWYRSYVKRFHNANTADLVLATEWTQDQQNETFAQLQQEHRDGLKRDPANVALVFRGTTFEKVGNTGSAAYLDRPSPIFSEAGTNPFTTPPQTPSERDGSSVGMGVGSHATTYRTLASDAFASAGIKAPCKSPPSLNRHASVFLGTTPNG